jgi:hypothetical protein
MNVWSNSTLPVLIVFVVIVTSFSTLSRVQQVDVGRYCILNHWLELGCLDRPLMKLIGFCRSCGSSKNFDAESQLSTTT